MMSIKNSARAIVSHTERITLINALYYVINASFCCGLFQLRN